MMGRAEFLKSLDEVLELAPGTLTGPEKLEDFPLWDSTAVISFMALADSSGGKRVSAREVSGCQTVADLLKIAGAGQ